MAAQQVEQALEIEKVLKLVQADGILSKTLKGFESRSQQQMMLSNVVEAYNQNLITLIEAGTGTGKSLAYLIPALLWATEFKERTVISTHTITLQEQLVQKDIPMLIEAMNLKLKVVLVKGMSNYVCLRKLEDAQMELRLFPADEGEEIQKIEKWSKSTSEGSRSELPFVPSPAAWDRVGAESEACARNDCPYHQQCFFFKARRQASEAQILVVNHALLFADLAVRGEVGQNDPAILPPYHRIVIDEAHHIEDMATEFFAKRLHRLELMRVLGKLSSEKNQRAQGKLPLLKEKLQTVYNKTPPQDVARLIVKLTIDLPALRHVLNEYIHKTFESYSHFIDCLRPPTSEEAIAEQKLRLLPDHHRHFKWEEEIIPQTSKLIAVLREYRHTIDGIESELSSIKNERLQEQTKGTRMDIQALLLKIEGSLQFLEQFLTDLKDPNKVRWIEAQRLKALTNIHLIDANLDVSEALVDFLFSKFPTIVLCSATLSTNQRFNFIRERLGLTEALLEDRKVTEHIYDSPFDYQKQALLVVPTDMPPPFDPRFNEMAYENIWKAVHASRGNAFVLFTSYQMLQNCHQVLAKRFEEHGYTVFKQGDTNRRELLKQFKKTNYSVLLGTDSFWEGVDVAGDALRCVIIAKLPFKVPTEPIIQARGEAITARGGDPFFEYSVPNAIVKFKQGFGRLIRNKWDRGCIVCLDNRLVTKGYGRLFLNSLPACEKIFADSKTIFPKMVEFYRKTYHLVKQNPFS